MDDLLPQLAPILSTLLSAAVVVLFRLIDRYIPDTTGDHPLPRNDH